MPIDRSELSSLGALLRQLTERVAQMGEQSAAAKEDDESKALFSIERALVGAQRRMDRLLKPRR